MNAIYAISGLVVKEMLRRKDFYVLFVLTALISVLMASVSFFGDDKIASYLKEICLLLIWICSLVIAATTTARQIPSEKESRTIFPLLAKPVTRWQLVLGKFIGSWVASGFALLVFYIFFVVLAACRDPQLQIVCCLQAFLLHWAMLAIVIALVLFGSIIFAAPSSNITISMILVVGILLLGRHLGKIALKLTEPGSSILYSIYFAIPHLEFFDIRDIVIHKYPPIEWGIFALAVLYGAAYAGLLLVLTWLVFRKKSLA